MYYILPQNHSFVKIVLNLCSGSSITYLYIANHFMLYYIQVRTLFLQWLPWLLRMQRPGKPITRKTIMMTNRMRELELKEKSSKSLLANVLDMDDDFR